MRRDQFATLTCSLDVHPDNMYVSLVQLICQITYPDFQNESMGYLDAWGVFEKHLPWDFTELNNSDSEHMLITIVWNATV